MRVTRLTALVFAIIAILLGGFWLLQGLGIVHPRPILCFADCTPFQGPSLTWAIVGSAIVAVLGRYISSVKTLNHPRYCRLCAKKYSN